MPMRIFSHHGENTLGIESIRKLCLWSGDEVTERRL